MVVTEAQRTLSLLGVFTRSQPMTTEEQLLDRYGPLLSLTELSELLKRSPDGLRIALRSQTEFAQKWNAAKRKVGRRVYFRASDVAELIDEA
jgi:ribosomal protein S12